MEDGGLCFVLTSGGPGTATYTLSLYSWQRFTFVNGDMVPQLVYSLL